MRTHVFDSSVKSLFPANRLQIELGRGARTKVNAKVIEVKQSDIRRDMYTRPSFDVSEAVLTNDKRQPIIPQCARKDDECESDGEHECQKDDGYGGRIGFWSAMPEYYRSDRWIDRLLRPAFIVGNDFCLR